MSDDRPPVLMVSAALGFGLAAFLFVYALLTI